MSDTELLIRTFDVELAEAGDGRTLEGLIVPYETPTRVDDGEGPYTEVFVKGAFSRAVKAPNRVWLNFEHKPGITNVLGHGVSFEERDDALYGSVLIDEGSDGEKALRLYRQRVLTGLSVEFKPMSRQPQVDGVVRRDSVHLDAVALCRVGAYSEAQVLAVRTDPLLPLEHAPGFDPELAAALGRFVTVPAALQVRS